VVKLDTDDSVLWINKGQPLRYFYELLNVSDFKDSDIGKESISPYVNSRSYSNELAFLALKDS
jgi:hypothetical protein